MPPTSIDQEVNQLCGEVWNQMEEEENYNREDPLGGAKAIFHGIIFTLCAGLLFFCGAVIFWCFQ